MMESGTIIIHKNREAQLRHPLPIQPDPKRPSVLMWAHALSPINHIGMARKQTRNMRR
jgi:hypothetical protein